jgi:hypothetical protein
MSLFDVQLPYIIRHPEFSLKNQTCLFQDPTLQREQVRYRIKSGMT